MTNLSKNQCYKKTYFFPKKFPVMPTLKSFAILSFLDYLIPFFSWSFPFSFIPHFTDLYLQITILRFFIKMDLLEYLNTPNDFLCRMTRYRAEIHVEINTQQTILVYGAEMRRQENAKGSC